jgi:DNA-binding HxlR family transcriptional regulator
MQYNSNVTYHFETLKPGVKFMRTKSELPECPVATTVQLVGSKWKLLIVRNLLVRPWRFNELKKNLDGISQKVLTDSLRSMEEDGLINRTVYAEVPPRVEYSLSELGESLRPVLETMRIFGLNYQERARSLDEEEE